MTGCESCAELHVTWRIRSPGELRKAIRVAADNLDDGTLVEVMGDHSFRELQTDEGFPDHARYEFRCSSCGTGFTLSAETYHGSGGAWKPHADDSRAV